MPYFRIARDPTAAALADPYLGQSIGPVPGYGVSLIIYTLQFTFHYSHCISHPFFKFYFLLWSEIKNKKRKQLKPNNDTDSRKRKPRKRKKSKLQQLLLIQDR